MPRRKRETHVWYVHGDDVINVESYSRKLNNGLMKLQEKEPDTVTVIENDSGFLRAEVKRDRLTFRFVRPLSEKSRAALSESGKRHRSNLKNQK